MAPMTASGNFNWAQALARKRLLAGDRQEVTEDMPSLPGEVWAVVAEILASDNDSSAINHLNASCWKIYHATLPVLYETVHLKSLNELERTVELGDPGRWRHVKFLYVGRSSSATELQEQQQEDDAWRSTSSRIDHIPVLSRLTLLAAVVNVTETPSLLQLILFRPISLPTLLEVCNKWTLANARDIVGLFTPDSYFGESRGSLPCVYKRILGNITDLVIGPGAYVSRPMSAKNTTYTPPNRNVKWCNGKVVIAGEVDIIGIKQTLEMMFDYPGRVGKQNNDISQFPRSRIRLECSSSVLSLVTEAIRDCRNSPSFDCRVRLSCLITRSAMESHIISLADAYSRHWTHRVIKPGDIKVFLQIESEAAPEELSFNFYNSFTAKLSIARGDEEIREEIFSREPGYDSGFTATLWETDGMRPGHSVWERAYPMDHVPVPTYRRIRS